MRKINIETIPHLQQRYDTCGDYWIDDDNVLQVRVSKTISDKYEFLILIHELIEQFLSEQNGVSQTEIDRFDIAYEKNRTEKSSIEPGDDRGAPYWQEHQFATGIERMLCAILGSDWRHYEKEIDELE